MQIETLSRLMGRPAEVMPVPLKPAYPRRVLVKEGIKAFLGTATCLFIVFVLKPTPYIGWPIGAVGLLFFSYLLQQMSRYFLRLHVDDTGVIHEVAGRRKAIRWTELRDMRLNFYPQTKGAKTGTLVMILKAGKTRIKIDSTLDHFPTVLSKAAAVAREKEIFLHPTTAENLSELEL
ncbi:MAG: hypothetical protein O7A69_04370 [SAR324 cluster bacterium]|nr:hypothetical protein [SAR324 cluster bacterium]